MSHQINSSFVEIFNPLSCLQNTRIGPKKTFEASAQIAGDCKSQSRRVSSVRKEKGGVAASNHTGVRIWYSGSFLRRWNFQVESVQKMDSGEAVNYSSESRLITEKFEVV